MTEIIVSPPRGGKGRGLSVISDALAPYESAFAVARQCANLRPSLPVVRDLETARIVRARLLPCCEQIYFAARALADMASDNPRQRITKADAAEMLGYLFAVLKRSNKGADAASWLTACVEMITADAALAQVIGVKPLPQHPAVLTLAIRKIIASAIFPTVPGEVAMAMRDVRNRIVLLETNVRPLIEMARRAEQIIFREDRQGWLLPYVNGALPSYVADYLVDDDDAEWSAAVDALPHQDDSDA